MRSLSLFAALAGLSTLASTQLIDLTYVESFPDPTYTIVSDVASQTVTYNQDAALASAAAEATSAPLDHPEKREVKNVFEKRSGPCEPVPTTPNVYNAVIDPAEAFLSDANLVHEALNAPVPSGWTQTFSNLKAASQAHGYLGYYLMPSYDTQWCANKCRSVLGCQAFNTYFERSPSVAPAASCPDPPGTANIFCVLWGGPVSANNARNNGQWRNQFHVVITGSNGYVRSSALTPLSSKAINAPLDCNNNDAYMGTRMFTDGAPFDPERCAAVCDATSRFNIEHPQDPTRPPKLCKFFNTFILDRNYVSQGQVCSMYTQYWDPNTYATNDGQWDGQGNRYTISSSVFVFNATDVVTPVCPADITRLRTDSAAGAFCTSYISYSATTNLGSTSTTTISACPTRVAKRDEAEGEIVEAVVAVYPQKIDAEATGSPALVTIPGESLSVSGIYASATSAAAGELGTASAPEVTGTTAAPEVTSTTAAANRRRAVATPPIFEGRDRREISSACSRIATGTVTASTNVVATQTSYANCGQYPPTCGTGESPIIIAGSTTSSPQSIDDVSFTLQLPFSICIYDTCSTTVHPTTNGLLSVGSSASSAFGNYGIPAFGGAPYLHAFWDDLYIFGGQGHYMSYMLCGAAGSRTVTFDWRLGHFGAAANGPLFSFSATFYEDSPSKVYLRYYGISDRGSSATVGIEGTANGRAASYQYSLNSPTISNGLNLIFDPRGNYFGVAP